MTGHQLLQMRRLSASSWLVRVDFLPSSCWSLRFCVPFIALQIPLFYFPRFQLPRQVLFLTRFEMCAWSVCLYRKSIFISFVISGSNLYFIACLFFIYRKYSFLISSLLIAFFRHSFMCPYWEFFFRHKPTYLDSTGLVVSAGCSIQRKESLYFRKPISRSANIYIDLT